MPATSPSLEHLRDLYPGFLEQAALVYPKDPYFRGLCEIHTMCVKGARRSEASQFLDLRAAYADQQSRLEAALVRRLQAPPAFAPNAPTD
jgi:hypothetical protein